MASGDKGDGAVAVLDEAMVARGHDQVESTGDPTAHAVMVVLREAARRLGRSKLSGMIIFAAHEPCTMCVGALTRDGRGRPGVRACRPRKRRRRIFYRVNRGTRCVAASAVVSGIMQAEAAELVSPLGVGR